MTASSGPAMSGTSTRRNTSTLPTGRVRLCTSYLRTWLTVALAEDLIKFNGYQVSVAELESILIADPAVSDAGVVPLNSEEKATELPFAYLVAAPGVEKTDAELKRIIDDLGSHVAFYKKLRGGAEWIDAIPKNASGKILHRELREKLKKDKADAK